MQWTRKEHQFDMLGKRIKQIDSIVIYGAGDNGKMLYKKLTAIKIDMINAFIDNDIEKQAMGCFGKNVLAPCEFYTKYNPEATAVIVSVHSEIILYNLMSKGYYEGINVFCFDKFESRYLSVFLLYLFDLLYFPEITISITKRCSLSCQNCSLLIPYSKSKNDKPFDCIQNDVDTLFGKCDYIGRFAIIGGEPFLYKQLQKVLSYITDNYSQRIGELRVVTNLKARLSDSLLIFLKEKNIVVEYTDYSQEIGINELVTCNIKLIKEYLINFVQINHDIWVDYNFIRKENNQEKSLVDFFDNCHSMCRGVENGNLIMCLPGFYANETVLNVEDKNNRLSIQMESKYSLLEYYFGFTESGYIEPCMYCRGSRSINKRYVSPGKQLE